MMNSRTTLVLTAVLASALAGLSCNSPAQTSDREDASEVEERSYSVGYDLGEQTLEGLAADGLTLDTASIIRGLSDAIAGRDSQVSERRMRAVLADIEREVGGRQANERLKSDPVFRAWAEENLRLSREFHASFADETGVTTSPSGMQHRVIATGSGRSATKNDAIVATFTARLQSGYVFGEGRETEFVVDELMPGARQMVMQMREGDHWYVALPPALAFGLAGRDSDIGPNETVLIDVRIIDVREPSP